MPAESSDERILTLHPDGKKGVKIPLSRYNKMYDTLLGIFAEQPEITYKEMSRLTEERLKGILDGSILWLMETVKLDMLARGIIRKVSENPVKLQIVNRGE